MNTSIGKDVLCLVRFVFREWAQYPVNQRVRPPPHPTVHKTVCVELPYDLTVDE